MYLHIMCLIKINIGYALHVNLGMGVKLFNTSVSQNVHLKLIYYIVNP